MAGVARTHVRFVEPDNPYRAPREFRDYVVELRQGQARRSIGRISGRAGCWEALPIAATAWSRRHRTRAAALRALHAREDFRYPHTYI